ncbi:hypothetical protein RFI_31516 [Reticulomyxa filosa]|uniref:Uncharacterized protein n=1 Tax=Reticulomyxa filosa TaxID=46433 RepID=X6LYU6_RETFI|nr:hypothetical protein RFI_31516 [Reticulomyxa filosa]|eukprot:ETO05875.1 hypothetical protein RFI_31516 [Reticulomyxa filosa]
MHMTNSDKTEPIAMATQLEGMSRVRVNNDRTVRVFGKTEWLLKTQILLQGRDMVLHYEKDDHYFLDSDVALKRPNLCLTMCIVSRTNLFMCLLHYHYSLLLILFIMEGPLYYYFLDIVWTPNFFGSLCDASAFIKTAVFALAFLYVSSSSFAVPLSSLFVDLAYSIKQQINSNCLDGKTKIINVFLNSNLLSKAFKSIKTIISCQSYLTIITVFLHRKNNPIIHQSNCSNNFHQINTKVILAVPWKYFRGIFGVSMSGVTYSLS